MVSAIQNAHHPIKYIGENFDVMDNVVSMLTYVYVNFRHGTKQCLQKGNNILKL